ncbi:LPS O-antigen chain length determinant protein WzzB [Salmonella enterica]|uniref:Chain length determinant protein n=1 Tax=Salmonella enterica TaxID=28901 RepID=A0A749L8A6_SALER|nr:LPS O-antigen chain length determinant protein WzzB [Salmonella enterica]HBL9999253.1 LPS O-antigen chain length determinant protein WzzB [Salmonella enterica subsp. enterica serovar Kodjovi]HCM8913331.1 LPS O-antigen chain length determinant protein WzzB [Salmonella enterica subsp. enterica serovar Paratyphi B]EEF8371652.1 LPS O-antigen chain length determinant protein WzzB [Salmonella enterica]EEI4535140.1 LPS O-antigen chain length determinant protein WzzB [Salmonella enterica]
MTMESNRISTGGNIPGQTDLIDLAIQLRDGAVTIIVFMLAGILMAIGYLMAAEEHWTSTAVITRPDIGQVAGYYNVMTTVYGKDAPGLPEVQTDIADRFNSAFSALSDSLRNQKEPEKLSAEPSEKGQPFPVKVSYVGTTAGEAQRQLAEYLRQVEEKTVKELNEEMKTTIVLHTGFLLSALRQQEVVAREQKDQHIRQLEAALRYAEEAKIDKPHTRNTQYVTQDTMFLLGKDALKSMTENEATRPLTFSDDYYQMKQKLFDIRSLKPDTVHPYRCIMPPRLPVRRDSPKTALTLVLAVLLGGMAGAGMVLGRNAFRNIHCSSC